MDDADLAGPIIFCFCFALFLLLVSTMLYILSHIADMLPYPREVWEISVRLHLWCRSSRIHIRVYSPQLDVGVGHRRVPRNVRSRILPATDGRSWGVECSCDTRVRSRYSFLRTSQLIIATSVGVL